MGTVSYSVEPILSDSIPTPSTPASSEDDSWLFDALPLPARDAHKYSRGMLIAFVGSKAYPGAALLASDAALRMGAGYVHVVSAKQVLALVVAHRPSVVAQNIKSWKQNSYRANNAAHPCAYLVGSGFDASKASSAKTVIDVLTHAQAPVLVDGGGLAALCTNKARQILAKRAQQGYATILTPHSGEAARLCEACGISNDLPREQQAYALAKWYRATIVLKGPTTFVCDETHSYHMTNGTCALAKAGTGDVLAGIIASLLAQGLDPHTASALGTRIHAQAGCLAAQSLTEVSVCAEDVVDAIGAAILFALEQNTPAQE